MNDPLTISQRPITSQKGCNWMKSSIAMNSIGISTQNPGKKDSSGFKWQDHGRTSNRPTGAPRLQKNAHPQDPTVLQAYA